MSAADMVFRSPEEIVARCKSIERDDFFGFQRAELIAFLPFGAAREFLRPDVTAEQWKDHVPTVEKVTAVMLDYMPFAWKKANDRRGISASRSVEHMKAWLWLLDEEALAEDLGRIYEFYGKPCLQVICDCFGWDWKQWDDGAWTNEESDEGGPPQPVGPVQLKHATEVAR